MHSSMLDAAAAADDDDDIETGTHTRAHTH
jgi:hypothetical protein